MDYCYAVMMDNGVVKFGRTTKIKDRIVNHCRTALSMKVGVVGALVSYVENSDTAEKAILNKAREAMTPMHGNEYFEYASIYDVYAVMNDSLGGFLQFNIDIKDKVIGISLTDNLTIKSHKGEVKIIDHAQKIYETIKGNPGISQGVIINRTRGVQPEIILSALSDMEAEGVIFGEREMHPRNKTVSVKYSISVEKSA